MENIWITIQNWFPAIKENPFTFDIPLTKIILVAIVLTLTQALRKYFAAFIVNGIERLTSKTETTLDDELIKVLKPSLSLLTLLGGIWLVQVILAEELGPQISAAIIKFLNLIAIVIVAFVIYRASSILGQLLANSVLRTDTDLDDILRPFVPRIFQTIAIVVIILKGCEIFLGQSAAALVGVLGGAGITLGLLFKDIVYDWFCTVVIYSDGLFREGDWLMIPGLSGFTQVIRIGFRSTTLRLVQWGSIVKLPNSKMIDGSVENWSQHDGEDRLMWGLNLTLKIDGISGQKTAKICASLREICKSLEGVVPEKVIVRFQKLEDNARVILITVLVDQLGLYSTVEEQLNVAILELLEQEGIDSLSVKLQTEPQKYSQLMKDTQYANN
ncbi:MAG: mechanosensitive ion channel [Symploca sp. SIO3C6]|uniref:Mechanosensitive ion channel n=1 Tax=Symploca sp. SIO1C4 TaxID=2607765 RepID=A0A6B3NA26_9CYAN|nr:mechanosensitive ion channel [Symploca sp. SIO3C6]NER27735.1 mechanosensitive ion channel [Symploca sp. SIO1C4]NET03509.1 mechanosensitive ion channel [Symploca sp. SIO2B6]NET50100.1 mechanosensitive ion channel [Merismopedia sp. SIO2A8]